MANWLVQGIGFTGLLFLVLSFQQNSRKRILAFILIGQLIFLIHFIFLGAWTAVAMNSVGAARTLLFHFKEEKIWARKAFWPWVFIAAFILFGSIAWESWYSFLPILAMSIETIGLWMNKPKTIRIINLFPHPFWFTYNLIAGSWPGVATEVLVFGSVLLGIWRYDRKNAPDSNTGSANHIYSEEIASRRVILNLKKKA